VVKQAEQICRSARFAEDVRVGASACGIAPNQGSCSFSSRTSRIARAKAARRRRSSASCSRVQSDHRRDGDSVLPPRSRAQRLGGFQYELLDQSGGPIENLQATRRADRPRESDAGLARLFTQFTANDPQWSSTSTRTAKSLGCRSTTSAARCRFCSGSAYVNDFDFNNRSYRVYVQPISSSAESGDIEKYYVRTAGSRMMP